MSRHLAPLKLAFTLSLLALSACDESTTPTQPTEPASQTAAAAVSYSAQDLGLGGEFDSRATGINTAGHVVGYTFDPDDTYRVFIWNHGVITRFRSSLGGRHARAFDINDGGQVVGSGENTGGKMVAFRWTNGTMTGLGTLGGSESRAFAINNKGHVVGQSQLGGDLTSHAFLIKNGKMKDLGTLGGRNSAALDINDAGQVVGWSETKNGTRHPFLWQNGRMRDLLPRGSAGVTGTAYAINSVGVVVGEKNNRASRYSRGHMRILHLGTMGPSVATGIRGGRIVGNIGGRAFVLVGGELTLLPLLPRGVFSAAYAVNGAGVVVGNTTIDLAPDPSCPGGVCAGFDLVTMWTTE
jgi:probable HAF family extracellular repeat protein